MRKLLFLLVGMTFVLSLLESCVSSRSCPAYGTVRENNSRRR